MFRTFWGMFYQFMIICGQSADLLNRDVFFKQTSTSQPVADPGFPRGGTHDFANFPQKLHGIERIWTPGASLAPPLDPPVATSLILEVHDKSDIILFPVY